MFVLTTQDRMWLYENCEYGSMGGMKEFLQIVGIAHDDKKTLFNWVELFISEGLTSTTRRVELKKAMKLVIRKNEKNIEELKERGVSVTHRSLKTIKGIYTFLYKNPLGVK
jgi:hypothetical protein